MRFHVLLFLLSLILLKTAYAQPVLTMANTAPVAGDSIVMQMYEPFPEFPGGAAAFWDYSEATPYGTALHNSWYSDVAWAMYGPAPAGANIVLNSPTSSSFHIISNAVWLRIGSIQNLSTDTMFTYYNNPDTVMVFPFGYQDSFYNSFTSVLLYDNVEFCSQTDTFIADGWGALKMPGGAVHNDVLRVKNAPNAALRIQPATS